MKFCQKYVKVSTGYYYLDNVIPLICNEVLELNSYCLPKMYRLTKVHYEYVQVKVWSVKCCQNSNCDRYVESPLVQYLPHPVDVILIKGNNVTYFFTPKAPIKLRQKEIHTQEKNKVLKSF